MRIKKKLKNSWFFVFFFFLQINTPKIYAIDLNLGKELFELNCNICHLGGNNIIIPEKNLKKETLELNGMNNLNSITYQIINGKNGMPAFGGRLNDSQIEEIGNYIMNESLKNFKE